MTVSDELSISHDSADAIAFIEQLPQTYLLKEQERTAIGKSLRQKCSRSDQALLDLPSNRTDPVDILIENSQDAWKI